MITCISAKYCPILTNHINEKLIYSDLNNFKTLTLMTGFVVQGHIWWFGAQATLLIIINVENSCVA